MRGAPRAAPVAKAKQRVRGRGVAVDGDGVERVDDALAQQRLQRRRRDRRVGEDEGQHRRHVGRDHAGALGEAVDGHVRAAEPRLRGGELRKRVGRHDRAGGVGIAVGGGLDGELRHDAVESLRRQRLADDAGRSQKHFGGLAADRGGGELGGEGASLASAFAGEGVGIAGIDDQRPGARALDPGAAPFDRRRRAFRAREHAGDAGALVEHRQHDVGAVAVADAGGAVASRTPAIGGMSGMVFGARGEIGVDTGKILCHGRT